MWRRLQKPTNSGNVSSISTCSSTKRIRSACFARTSANCRTIDSRVPIFRARCSSSISHQLEGANSSKIASATSVRVIVPSKSVRTASLEVIEGSPSAPRASRAFAPRAEVRALLLREPIDLEAQAVEFEPSDLQVEILRDGIHAGLQLRGMLGKVSGGDGLDREAHVHDLDGVALSGRDIQEAAFTTKWIRLPSARTYSSTNSRARRFDFARRSRSAFEISLSKWPAFPRTPWSFSPGKCAAVTMSLHPVAEMMKSAIRQAFCIGRTSNPSIVASIALTGSTSVTMTRAPIPRARIAIPRPVQP